MCRGVQLKNATHKKNAECGGKKPECDALRVIREERPEVVNSFIFLWFSRCFTEQFSL